ncbi:hypothetical protein [Streptomyces sp. Ag109_G2-15]|uniref:hypothetical protein n=1 Tax=Streptomyces sp. Ag109_G2-15 TaxID=1938850 RepID=UPI000BDDE953|nr:hypothetical protein [Streptomyces sp. Ag109_G2-15]SOE07975.1 hypothetical protein SAMN06272765_8898 [Streptomyces sp. Ag109_G2-15]
MKINYRKLNEEFADEVIGAYQDGIITALHAGELTIDGAHMIYDTVRAHLALLKRRAGVTN